MQIFRSIPGCPDKLRCILIMLLLQLGGGGHLVLLSGQSPDWVWANQIITPGNEFISSVAVDPSDNSVYAVGNWSEWGIFPPGGQTHTNFISTYGGEDGFLVKFDSASNYLWGFKLGGDSHDRVTSVTLDDEGSVYITGYFGEGRSYFYGTGSPTAAAILDNPTNEDFFLAKYDSSGVFQWIRRSDSDGGNVGGEDVCTNSSLVFAVGSFIRRADFGPLITGSNPLVENLFLVCYDKDGNEQWIATGGSGDVDIAISVVADDEAVYFTGWFSGGGMDVMELGDQYAATMFNGNPGIPVIPIISFDPQGYFRWAQMIQSSGIDRGWGLCMDSDSLYITGGVNDGAFFPAYAGNPVSASFQRDIFLSSHSKVDGQTGWIRVFPCTDGGNEQGKSIDITADNYLLVSGDFAADLSFPGGNTVSSAGANDVFFASYTSDGEFLWGTRAGSSGDDGGNGIAAGSQGVIYAGGSYDSEMDAGPFILADQGNNNGFLFKMQGSSAPPANDAPCEAQFVNTDIACNPGVYDNRQATNSGVPDPGCGSYSGNDLWFKAVVPVSGNLYIGTNTSTDSTYPPVNGWMWRVAMAVYTGNCDNLNLEGCYLSNSAYNYRGASAYLQNQNPGDTIWVRIWEVGGGQNGLFEFCAYDPGHNPDWEIPGTLCSNAGPIDLWSTMQGPVIGAADQIAGQNGVPDPADALGVADDTVARLHDNGDWIKLDLTDTIPVGEVYWLYFRPNTSGQTARASLSVSVDDVNYSPHSFEPEAFSVPSAAHPIIAEQATRYVLIENVNSGAGGFRVDGIEYEFRGTRGGSWSGPGVTGSTFDPAGLSGAVNITYTLSSAGKISNASNTVEVLHSDAGVATGDTTVCAGNNQVVLGLNNFSGNIIDWESSSDGFTTAVSVGSVNNSLIINNLFSSIRYRAIVQAGNCAADTSDVIEVRVLSNPVADPGPEADVCGLSGELYAQASIGFGTWSLASGPGTAVFSPSETEAHVRVEVSEFGDYAFTWTEQNGVCSDDSTLSLSFLDLPVAEAGPDQVLEYQFETLLEADIPPAGEGSWEVISGTGIFQDMHDPHTRVSSLSLGENLFRWTLKTALCGPSSDSVSIIVEGRKNPTVITPNRDGLNDFFVLSGAIQQPGCELIVYNRWGVLVYRNSSYQNDWDGRDQNGRELIADTYYYVLKIPPGRIEKGFVEIKR